MQFVYIILTLIAFFVCQALIGGAKLVYSIPAYLVIAVAGFISIISAVRNGNAGARTWPIISTLLLGGYVVWRAVASPVPGIALTDLLMVLGALCVYLLMALHVVSPKARLWFLVGCFFLGFLHVAAGVIQFRYQDDFMFLSHLPDKFPIPQLFRGTSGWRASGFYVCPNHTAGFLESLCAFAVAYCCWGRFSAIGRIVLGYVVVFCLVGIALTGSRGGYLSTAFGLSVLVMMSLWFLKRLRSSRFGMVMIGAVVLGVLVIGGAWFGMSKNATIGNRMNEISYDAGGIRFDMWQAAVKQSQVSPLCGTGSGTYLYYGRQFRSPNVQRDPIHVHCDYLELLAEYGIVGCVLMAFFLGTHIFSAVRAAMNVLKNRLRATGRSFSNELAILAGGLATIAALLAHSVVDFNFHLPANTLFFAAVFGMLACPTSDPKLLDSPKVSWIVRAAYVILPLASVFLAVKSVSIFRGEYHTEWARVHLRNKLFYDSLASFQASVGWSLAPLGAGVLPPPSGTEGDWSFQYQKDQLFPSIEADAKKALAQGSFNVDAWYYMGEALSFMALYDPDPARRIVFQEAALNAFSEGYKVFPQDTKFIMKLGRAYANLGRFEEAEAAMAKGIAADPNFGNSYAFYGIVLMQQRKLIRADAYFRRAIAFPTGNDLASTARVQILEIRARALNRDYVERFGNPLENYDMEPPTDEDMARGVGLPQNREE